MCRNFSYSSDKVPCEGVTQQQKNQHTLPSCPLPLVALVVELPPLFHSLTGHSEYCWELSWDCEPDCITVSNELMVSSVEGIPEGSKINHSIESQQKLLTCVYIKLECKKKEKKHKHSEYYRFRMYLCETCWNIINFHLLSTCAKAQNGPLGQYPVWRISLHLVDL